VQAHRVEPAAGLRDVAVAVGARAAAAAERPVHAAGAELVVDHLARAFEQAECLGLDAGAPVAGLAADRAIALAAAGVEIEVGFETHVAAVAAAGAGPGGHGNSGRWGSPESSAGTASPSPAKRERGFCRDYFAS